MKQRGFVATELVVFKRRKNYNTYRSTYIFFSSAIAIPNLTLSTLPAFHLTTCNDSCSPSLSITLRRSNWTSTQLDIDGIGTIRTRRLSLVGVTKKIPSANLENNQGKSPAYRPKKGKTFFVYENFISTEGSSYQR